MKRIEENSVIANRERADKTISFAICSQLAIVGIKNMLVQGIPFLYNNNDLINRILLLLIAIIYLHAVLKDKKKYIIDKKSFYIFSFVAISFVFTALIHEENIPYIIKYLPRVVPYCFVTCYLITRLSTLKWIDYYMRKFSVFIII